MHKADYHSLHAETQDTADFRAKFNGNYSIRQNEDDDFMEIEHERTSMLGGIIDNKLRRMNPIFNCRYDYLEKARAYYRQKK